VVEELLEATELTLANHDDIALMLLGSPEDLLVRATVDDVDVAVVVREVLLYELRELIGSLLAHPFERSEHVQTVLVCHRRKCSGVGHREWDHTRVIEEDRIQDREEDDDVSGMGESLDKLERNLSLAVLCIWIQSDEEVPSLTLRDAAYALLCGSLDEVGLVFGRYHREELLRSSVLGGGRRWAVAGATLVFMRDLAGRHELGSLLSHVGVWEAAKE